MDRIWEDFDKVSWCIVNVVLLYSIILVVKQTSRWVIEHNSKVARRERSLSFLVSIMLLFFVLGTACYFKAFLFIAKADGDAVFTEWEYLFRSLVCSFQLFAANIDSNVLDSEHIKAHGGLKGLLSVLAALSFLCTLAIIISLAYGRVKAYLKLHFRTMITARRNHLYVFWGMNAPSWLLAKSIRSQSEEKERALILFVENSGINEEEYSGWDSIIGMFTHRRQTFTEASELNARVTFTETQLCDIDIKDINVNNDILKETNLLKLRSLIRKLKKDSIKNDAELRIFFLSENEDENIRAMSILAQDKSINEVNNALTRNEAERDNANSSIKQQVVFYCHARQNGLNRVVEDLAVKRGLEVRIVDSSHLSVELLKDDEKNHPVRLVEIDERNLTTVKSEFNSLIVGFDEVGQDALRFLYEFGAFVSNEGTPKKEVRSPFHCIVADKRMDELKGIFSTFAPAAIKQTNKDGSKLIEFVKCDCMSGEFFEEVINISLRQKLNYVVIAIGDDELGMMLAIRIMSHIRRYREDLSRFRIYVRSYRPDKESYMQKIADYYNEGYNQDCQEKKEYQTDAVIIPFGKSENIYSYEMIIQEDLVKKGMAFQKSYCEMKGENEFWDTRRAVLTGAQQKTSNDNIPIGKRKVSLNNMRSLRRKESQDLANALHVKTKMFLFQKALGEEFDWHEFMKKYFNEQGKPMREGSYNDIKYALSDELNTAILNLARLEHLRWNASHEMLGYIKAKEGIHCCDERTRQHNCLRPWEELDEEGQIVSQLEGWTADYKAFDFSVVDVSIWLYYNKVMKKNGNESV